MAALTVTTALSARASVTTSTPAAGAVTATATLHSTARLLTGSIKAVSRDAVLARRASTSTVS